VDERANGSIVTLAASRDTICLEQAQVLEQKSFPGNQYILRVRAPGCASRAEPGSFAHLTCDPAVPMRRPLSIMRVDPDDGWVEFLYKPVGVGLAHLAARDPGESISLLGPIGNGFLAAVARPWILAIGGGVGIPPMFFLADRLRRDPEYRTVVLMGSEVPFPFELMRSELPVSGVPREASWSVRQLEEWDVPSRLASNSGLGGCYAGFVTELAREWLGSLAAEDLARVQVMGCGPTPMLKATAELAGAFGLPCQLALEEYMACGVGGCAGCTVLIHTPDGPAMQRVCVDGPVFDAYQVFPS
jgi:dihydroorotate dehydrogenase electron transfer subunit